MKDRRFPGVTKFKDRHGVWRWRARAKGKASVMIHGEYASPQFVREWNAWANGKPMEIGGGKTVPGSVSAAMVGYYGSDVFKDLSLQTQTQYRAALERIRVKNGTKEFEVLTAAGLRSARSKLKPEPWNMLLRAVRSLMKYALDAGLVETDPTAGLRKRKDPNANKDGIHTWTLEEVQAFEARHPLGTKAHLALSLFIYTAQRKSDVVRLGRQHEGENGGTIKFRQKKTGEWLELPIVAPLRASIDAAVIGDMTYLTTRAGSPFTANGFGNWFRDRCDEAGMPQCSAHGLRKAAATRLADSGATPHQIMAITGHRSISEVESYTRAANMKRLAQQMSGILAGMKEELPSGKPAGDNSVVAMPDRKSKK